LFWCPYKLESGEDCDYSTTHAGNLEQHERTHTGAKPYCCDRLTDDGKKCTRAFAQSNQLNDHIRRAHTKERPFECELLLPGGRVCRKTFASSSNLTRHQRSKTIHAKKQPTAQQEGSRKRKAASSSSSSSSSSRPYRANPAFLLARYKELYKASLAIGPPIVKTDDTSDFEVEHLPDMGEQLREQQAKRRRLGQRHRRRG
jgi:uncharacterized Zn-finger protein